MLTQNTAPGRAQGRSHPTASPATSVLLPTTRWTDACSEIAGQLRSNDELLVIHDDVDDPVAAHSDVPAGVRLIPAGEPTGCSGKANAIATGMDAASHERLVWTDDDFHHPPDWLETLTADYDRHGPVSEVPYFIGEDPLAVLIEPLLASTGSLGIYLLDQIWGGAVIFERDDIDEGAFLADLRQTVSDDALLMEYLQVTTVRRVHVVPIGGTVRGTVERMVRWTTILWRHDPGAIAGVGLILLLALVGGLLFPLYGVAVLTAGHLTVNEVLGVRRWTAILAYPGVFVFVPLVAYSLARRTFTWGGRRYRWPSKFDVQILE